MSAVFKKHSILGAPRPPFCVPFGIHLAPLGAQSGSLERLWTPWSAPLRRVSAQVRFARILDALGRAKQKFGGTAERSGGVVKLHFAPPHGDIVWVLAHSAILQACAALRELTKVSFPFSKPRLEQKLYTGDVQQRSGAQ